MSRVEEKLFSGQRFLPFTLNNEQSLAEPCSCTLANGTQVSLWDTGILYFQPVDYDKVDSIVISAGVHGNETAPIEIVELIVSNLLAGKIKTAKNVLIVLANPQAIKTNQRYIVENMNRLFHTELNTTDQSHYERRRASKLMTFTQRFFQKSIGHRQHYDLHTAIRGSYYQKFAVSPNRIDQAGLQQQFSFLHNCGIDAILISDKSSATYSAYTSRQCDANSFTLELGKVRPLGENNLDDFTAIINCLQLTITGHWRERAPLSCPQLFRVSEEVIKHTDDFKLCFDKDTVNFTEFAFNTPLAIDQNREYRAKHSGERIIFPNENVAIGQRALVVIQPTENLFERTL